MAYGSNAPFGLRPIQHLDGSPWNGGLQNLSISSGYATTIGYGDPVTTLSDGTIGRGVSAGPLLGVFMGCQYYDSNRNLINSKYWPASTTVATGTIPTAFVVTDPTVVYTVQETNGSGVSGTPLALAIGLEHHPGQVIHIARREKTQHRIVEVMAIDARTGHHQRHAERHELQHLGAKCVAAEGIVALGHHAQIGIGHHESDVAQRQRRVQVH